jgi:hypothetical protein
MELQEQENRPFHEQWQENLANPSYWEQAFSSKEAKRIEGMQESSSRQSQGN